ncbi:MAG TPA: FAD-dependent oxidoreductase [Acidisoma sp.]|jgi:NADPH-dependent 2,4-dienoyl-CoA reductase/sulfur reductase-like enzyme|uniref:NAD(P)/FAD-dependent oxidoreductase n=1 Tax=Acidisoma sp. TaxID=1872115 RepID=UPI002B773BF2|nr:FAD-dependent oxidoreductase [Acidisoma sp.]HTI02881.1 FAD-dependent oxidoreductase [Acidisoma sp.]
MQRYVIIGGGLAGHRAALELAKCAPGAAIHLLEDEDGLPYDRPPLSKEILNGTKEAGGIVLNGAAGYEKSGITYCPKTKIIRIDRVGRRVEAEDGRIFAYDALLLATGSRPRRLPARIAGDAEIHYLRTLEDSLRLRDRLVAGRQVAVIGGGFIGLEVAAAAIARGCRVTVLEALPRLLARAMPEEVSIWVQGLHEREGVDIRLSAGVDTMRREGDRTRLNGAEWTLLADVVIAGIGVVPNAELAAEAGLDVADGIVVDAFCGTADPAIFAAGEVTSHPVAGGGRLRIESWKSSGEQGAIAARNMCGGAETFDEVPWLWSDQFDANIQMIGLPDHAARHEILGDPASKAWTMVSVDGNERIVGGIAINRGRDASMLKRAVRNGAPLTFMRPESAVFAP